MWLFKLHTKILLQARNGVRDDIPYRAYSRRFLLVVYCIAVGIVYSLISMSLASAYNNWIGFAIHLNFISFSLISLYLLFGGQIGWGKTLFISSAIILYSLYANTNTFEAGMQYGWFVILFLIFALFSVVEKKGLYSSLFILAVCIGITEWANYELISISTLQLGGVETHNRLFLVINLILTSIFLYYLSSNFYKSYREKEKTNEFLTKQTQKLLKANKELDKFVYHAAHDIRAPITSMLGLVSLGKEETDLKRIHNFFRLQEKTINQLDSYVEQILSVSKVKHSQNLNEEIDFIELEQNLLDQSQFMFQANEMSINFKHHFKGQFHSNTLTLKTIVNNLLSNSIKYSDASKKERFVDITFKNSERFEGGLTLTVLDNGIGIPTTDISKITNIFFYNKIMNTGTGYGLYIVKEAVDNLHGDIKFESELGSHTLVTIDLPNSKEIINS